VYARNPTLGYLTTRKKYLKDEEGHLLEAFYMTGPVIAKGENSVSQEFYIRFASLAKNELQQAYDGRLTIDEALTAMQSQGQQLLMLKELKRKESMGAN
jgi:multiple sugar transport system substrate-binding protein